MTDQIIIDIIKKRLDDFQDWNPETFDFNVPVSIFSEEPETININSLIAPPVFDELKILARDPDNNSIRLNNSQLQELRTKGKFNVPSKNFEGQNHVWTVSKFLQSGTDNIKESFFDGLASASEHYVICIPDRIHRSKHFSIKNSLIEIKTGLCNIPGFIIGRKMKKNEHANHVIHTKLNEYVESEIVNTLIKSDNHDRQILFEFENGEHMGVSSSMYNLLIKKIKKPYDEFMQLWDKSAASREKHLYEKYKGTDMTKDEIIKHVVNQENQILQQKILELVNYVLPPHDAIILTNLFTCVYELRNLVAKYNRDKAEAIEKYQVLLQNKYHILYRIDKWKSRKINKFEKQWLKEHPIEDRLLLIAENFVGQEKHIFTNHIKIKKSNKYIELQKKLNQAIIPERSYTHKYRIWNHKKWNITKKYNGFSIDKYNIIKTSTEKNGWRITNLLKRSSRFMNNGSYVLLTNMLTGAYGLRSLFGFDDFNSDYKLSETGIIIPRYRYKTWFGRIRNLWKNISQSRTDFENKTENGILGKTFTRIFNVLYNYIIKGVIGTGMIAIGHPILVIINTIVALVGTVTSPIWAVIASIIIYLWCIFIYDIDAPDSQEYHMFPLVRTFFKKLLLGGLGQFIASLVVIISQVFVGAFSLTWTMIRTISRYCYDFFVYHLLLRHKAKIPSNDDFLVKRISGPGLSSKYFYLIDHRTALIMVQYVLEEMEMQAYKQETKARIVEPRNNLVQFYNQFNSLGLQINNNSDQIKNFTKTRDQLETKLKKIENDYWSNHKIKGSFKKNNRLRMDNENLSIAVKYASELCESYVNSNILPRLDETSQSMFWIDKKLEENDWNGLATHCLVSAFSSDIIQPYENTDKEGFHLNVKKMKAKKFLSKLFDGNPPENLQTEDFSLLANPSNIESDIQLITPNNLLSKYIYESMLFLNDDFFKKENLFSEFAELDNTDQELVDTPRYIKEKYPDQIEISDDEDSKNFNNNEKLFESTYQEYLDSDKSFVSSYDKYLNSSSVIIDV